MEMATVTIDVDGAVKEATKLQTLVELWCMDYLTNDQVVEYAGRSAIACQSLCMGLCKLADVTFSSVDNQAQAIAAAIVTKRTHVDVHMLLLS
jgi:hypothetical protein